MKKIILVLFTLFLTINTYGQTTRRNMNRIPETTREPSEQDIAKRERQIEERKEEYIDNFLTTLEADEFQKHIIKQNLNSFYDAKLAIIKTKFDHYLDRETAIRNLEDTHFTDLKELISEDDMTKIHDLVSGEFNEKKVVKKQRKKNGKIKIEKRTEIS